MASPMRTGSTDESGGSEETGGPAFQTECIKEPSENDVLCGRGGSINSHPGNERFRRLVEKRKRVYLTARFKREKRLIASSIVSEIRELDPPGRFLSRESKTGYWKPISDEKARDKTSQALRENAPTIRAEIETEINEKRVEMQRAEEEEARANASQSPSSHPYYNQGWGYHSYYGYSHPPPSSPHGPPHPPPHGPPGHSPAPGYHPHPPAPYEQGQWSGGPQYPPPSGYHGGRPAGDPYGPPPHHPPPPKSALEQTVDLVNSGTESIKNWTKTSFSFGGVNSTASNDGHDTRSLGAGSVNSKPIVYVHEDGSKKRRMVKFRDDSKYSQSRKRPGRPCYSPVQASAECNNSLVDVMDDDIEPQSIETDVDTNSSLMTQVANHILSSIGSWDAATIVCGQDNGDEKVPFPDTHGSSSNNNNNNGAPADVTYDEDMAVEWEGQEVQLVDQSAQEESVASEEKMPPPSAVRPRPVPDQASSIGFSSLGSCHSWLPEQFGSAASYFSYSKGGVSPSHSMEMEYSATGTENYSAAGSLGGASLTRVFEHETLQDSSLPPTSPNMSHRVLNQIPSWERSLRSKSPLSIDSGDDESLISKTSSKLSEGALSPANITSSANQQEDKNDDDDNNNPADEMVWETRE